MKKCKHEKTKASERIKNLKNAFLSGQKMSFQQTIHICLSIQLYHSTRSFQFINTCEENNRAFVLLPPKILNKWFPNSIDIHCKLLIENTKHIMNH